MRNAFGSKRTGYKQAAESYETFADESSPDQLAIVWNGAGEVVTAAPIAGNLDGSYDIDVARLPADFNLSAALKIRRENHLNLPPLSEQTVFSTVVPEFSERTRILSLDGETLSLDDDDLAEWLLSAEKQIRLGTDHHPIFETPLEDTACSVTRLPNGQVTMTEVPRQIVQETQGKMGLLFDGRIPQYLNLTVETQLRCTVRYFLNALPEGDLVLMAGKESEVTAFLLITKTGFSYGLWSPQDGLFSEYAFPAPVEIIQAPRPFNSEKFTYEQKDEAAREEPVDNETLLYETRLNAYIRHAFDQLFLQLTRERLEQLELSNYAQMVWAGELGLAEKIAPIAAEYSAKTGLESFQISVPVDEAVAGGLLFGSFAFGDITAAGAEILPTVNLAGDLLKLADKGEINRRSYEALQLQRQRNRTIFTLLAAPVLMLACILGLIANILRAQAMTALREVRADNRTLELKPALDRRKSYEANLKWYQEFITQVSRLRRQQPIGIDLQHDLDSRYPLDIDPAFYVSELKLLVNGGVEIRGLARNKDAVTTFLKALEFAGGPVSGTKLFTNLTYEVQEGVAPSAVPAGGKNTLPTMTGSALTGNNPPPGVIAWSIKGNYVPMAEFVPPDPAKKTPAAPQPAQPPSPVVSPTPAV